MCEKNSLKPNQQMLCKMHLVCQQQHGLSHLRVMIVAIVVAIDAVAISDSLRDAVAVVDVAVVAVGTLEAVAVPMQLLHRQ